MKFRCERDTLVEALGTAGRAVSGRGGMLPVLSGVKAELLEWGPGVAFTVLAIASGWGLARSLTRERVARLLG